MLKRILSFMEDQGYDEQSPMKLWQINEAFDNIISAEGPKRQFPRTLTSQIWGLTQKNEDSQVILGQFLQNMEKQNKLRHLLPQSYIWDALDSDKTQKKNIDAPQTQKTQEQDLEFPTEYKAQQANSSSQFPTKNLTYHKQQTTIYASDQNQQKQAEENITEPQIEQYSERESMEVRNHNYNQSASNNINATIAESEVSMGSLLDQESLVIDIKLNQKQLSEEKQHHSVSQLASSKHEKSTQPESFSKHIQNKIQSDSNKKSPQPDRKWEEIEVEQSGNLNKNKARSQIEPDTSKKSKKEKSKQKYSSLIQPNISSKSKKKKNEDSLKKPLLQYNHEPTLQQIEEELTKNIPRPEIKNKSGIKNKSIIKESTLEVTTKYGASSTLLTEKSIEESEENTELTDKKKKKCISKKWFIPMCLFAFGLIVFLSSFLIHSELKKLSAQQVVLSSQTENIWAHFPGDTKTQIDRNWTFFTLKNPDQMLFYNEKPQFRQIKGFKIIELEDYLNITYIEDGNRVQMIDWLHFAEQPETRNLDQKVQILNVGGLAYWYNIKIARPTIILQQGLGLLFNTLEKSILQNIYAQAINVQFLPEWSDDIYAEIFAPVEIPFEEAWFIWTDPAYGMGNQDNLKYWIEAVISKRDADDETVSEGFNFLMDYFTLSLGQLRFISMKFEEFVEFAVSSVLQNSYCVNHTDCTGRYLAYQQFSSSYVTRNPPPGKPIQPNDTICLSNVTCAGYYPELSAFYKNVYLDRHPDADSRLEFHPEWMKDLVNYNASVDKELDFNTAENCLFHIGNLDALWENGTMYEKSVQELQNNLLLEKQMEAISNQYLQNIQTRFKLPSLNHTRVFWEWIKYLNNQLILQNHTSEQLGVANLFANGLYEGFSYLQDHLQPHLLTELIHYDLQNQPVGDCSTFIQTSFNLRNNQTALKICDAYGQKITKELVSNLLSICTNQFKEGWFNLRHGYRLTLYELGSLCEYDESSKGSFGYLLHNRRKYLNDKYDCQITPKQYCSDFELAAIQWSSSKVTLNPPPELNFSPNHTYKGWNKNASRFEYAFYVSKYPNDDSFPEISTRDAYSLLNFDHWFSAPVVLKQFTNETYDSKLKAYMRFVALEVGLNGLTMERTARELIFGYKDEILEQVKHAYPPFGGDPSTPSLIAFNDPNITKEQATMTLQWSTGKQNSSLVGQYRKINGVQYLTIQKDFFNGNKTENLLLSPWQGQDYVYGTSAKQFAPNQFDQPNISLYVPNIQRYGSGVIDDTSIEERFGFEVKVGYLGESIYESTEQSDINKKYYQTFYAIFNETSVVGFPLFVTKNHFMNVSDNWTSLVEIYNEDSTIQYVNISKYDDSFVVVEPYTGLSFQSTIYLQSNYHHDPDSLLNFYQEAMLPVFSLARSGNITESVVDDLLGPLRIGIAVVKWTKIVGIVLVSVSCLVCGYIYYRKKKDEKMKQKSEESSGKNDDDEEKDKKSSANKQKAQKRQIKSSQLGISLQPMARQERKPNNEYIPPPVVEEQI